LINKDFITLINRSTESFLISDDQTLINKDFITLINRSTESFLISDDQTLINKDFKQVKMALVKARVAM